MTDPDENANLLMLREDKNAQQACILYEILQKTGISDAFDIFCDVFGEDAMEFREFEFFFYKLGKENAELGSELRFNPKSRQLLELPNEMLNEIFDHVKPIELFKIRKVSRRFRDVIGGRAPGFKQIDVEISNSNFTINFDNDDEDVQYWRKNVDDEDFTIEYREHKVHVESGCIVEAGLSDLYRIMKNPKFSLEIFDVKFDRYLDYEKMEIVEEMMKKVKYIKVKKFVVRDCDTINHVLPYLRPKTLEELHFVPISSHVSFDGIVNTLQFCCAKKFFIDDETCKLSTSTRIDNFFHLTHFIISVEEFTTRDAMKIKNILMKKPGFKYAKILVEIPNQMEILRVFYPAYPEPLPPGVRYETDGDKFALLFISESFEVIKVENFDISDFEDLGDADDDSFDFD